MRQDRDKTGKQKHRRPQEVPADGMAMQAQRAGQPVMAPDESIDQGKIAFGVCGRLAHYCPHQKRVQRTTALWAG